ncbi:hypothetical protein BaRGS_00000951, partial [Batillaria attramentaria]
LENLAETLASPVWKLGIFSQTVSVSDWEVLVRVESQTLSVPFFKVFRESRCLCPLRSAGDFSLGGHSLHGVVHPEDTVLDKDGST